jgi:hypothetical protein
LVRFLAGKNFISPLLVRKAKGSSINDITQSEVAEVGARG